MNSEPSEIIFGLIDDYISFFESDAEKIKAMNKLRLFIHNCGPFSHEPVDCIQWVPLDAIITNDYNPNVMAIPEEKLLRHSLEIDGFTQPIVVSFESDRFTVVDGAHRFIISSKSSLLKSRLKNHLPIVVVNNKQKEKRIATTIRHNRARGEHRIASMSAIILDLSRLGWDDAKIGKELGMQPDEVLRLKQIEGLVGFFEDKEFSLAWTVSDN